MTATNNSYACQAFDINRLCCFDRRAIDRRCDGCKRKTDKVYLESQGLLVLGVSHNEESSSLVVCVFDNPANFHREAWQGGKLIASINAGLLYSRGFCGHPSIFFGLNVGSDFSPGQVVGDVSALPEEVRRVALV